MFNILRKILQKKDGRIWLKKCFSFVIRKVWINDPMHLHSSLKAQKKQLSTVEAVQEGLRSPNFKHTKARFRKSLQQAKASFFDARLAGQGPLTPESSTRTSGD